MSLAQIVAADEWWVEQIENNPSVANLRTKWLLNLNTMAVLFSEPTDSSHVGLQAKGCELDIHHGGETVIQISSDSSTPQWPPVTPCCVQKDRLKSIVSPAETRVTESTFIGYLMQLVSQVLGVVEGDSFWMRAA